MLKIYHNRMCSKSCSALQILQEQGLKPEIQEYLTQPPSRDDLIEILKLLKIKPFDLIRKNEPVFIDLYKDRLLSDDEWINTMIEQPILIERPIIIRNGKALIGRQVEKIIEFLVETS